MNADCVTHSHLFTIRLWLEDLGEGKHEWRGKVTLVENGQAFYFRDWQTLIDDLQTLLASTHTLLATAVFETTPPV